MTAVGSRRHADGVHEDRVYHRRELSPEHARGAGTLCRHVPRAGSVAVRQGRQPLQAARLRVPVGGDLRRLPLDLRLRAARRAAAAQREERVVALDGAAARRHRRARRRHPLAARDLGGVGPPRELHRPARRLPQLQGAVPARQARRSRRPARTAARRTRFTEAAPVQPHVQDLRRARSRSRPPRSTCGPRRRRACSRNFKNVLDDDAARSRRSASRRSASRSATRSRRSNFVFRTREFEQMEMEYFVPPDEAPALVRVLVRGALQLVRRPRHPRRRSCACAPHDADELSHYSSGTRDVEFLFPWGWDELEGIANRGDYDLTQHAKHSGEKLEYFDQASGERYVPHVIEPAAGATRTTMAFLLAAYDEEEVDARAGKGETRTVLRLHPRLAPYKVAVLPLSKNETLDAARPARCSHRLAAALHVATTTRRRRSAGATGARTRSARRSASPSTSTRSTTTRSRSASATRWSRSGCPIDELVDHRARPRSRDATHRVVASATPSGRRTASSTVVRRRASRLHRARRRPTRVAVVFMNGWTCPDAYWKRIAPARRRRRVTPSCCFDTRGHGESSLPRRRRRRPPNDIPIEHVSVNRVATDIIELLDHAGLERAVLERSLDGRAGHLRGVPRRRPERGRRHLSRSPAPTRTPCRRSWRRRCSTASSRSATCSSARAVRGAEAGAGVSARACRSRGTIAADPARSCARAPNVHLRRRRAARAADHRGRLRRHVADDERHAAPLGR